MMTGRTTATKGAPAVMTPFQERKNERDRNLREDFRKLMEEEPGRSRMVVKDYLKGKYGISSDDAYYKILKNG